MRQKFFIFICYAFIAIKANTCPKLAITECADPYVFENHIQTQNVATETLAPSIQLETYDFQDASARIVNGQQVADPNTEAPWFARILVCLSKTSMCSICGSSWITGKHMLTAAHCVHESFTDYPEMHIYVYTRLFQNVTMSSESSLKVKKFFKRS